MHEPPNATSAIFPLFQIHATSGEPFQTEGGRDKGGGEEGGSKISGCLITQQAESESKRGSSDQKIGV